MAKKSMSRQRLGMWVAAIATGSLAAAAVRAILVEGTLFSRAGAAEMAAAWTVIFFAPALVALLAFAATRFRLSHATAPLVVWGVLSLGLAAIVLTETEQNTGGIDAGIIFTGVGCDFSVSFPGLPMVYNTDWPPFDDVTVAEYRDGETDLAAACLMGDTSFLESEDSVRYWLFSEVEARPGAAFEFRETPTGAMGLIQWESGGGDDTVLETPDDGHVEEEVGAGERDGDLRRIHRQVLVIGGQSAILLETVEPAEGAPRPLTKDFLGSLSTFSGQDVLNDFTAESAP